MSSTSADLPPSMYFSDDEHFNKKLQNGVSASTLFEDAMSHHRHQQHEYMFQQKQRQQQSSEDQQQQTTTTTGRGAAAFLNNQNQQQQQDGGSSSSPNTTKQSPFTSRAATATSSATREQQQQGDNTGENNNNTNTNNTKDDLGVMTSTSHLSDFPNISMDDPLYSSTIMMLKRTRKEISQLATELSASNMINELPASEDVRRIVAKIFADPRNSEAISESEWKRREQSYVSQRDRLADKINDHLEQEKAALQEEIKRLGMDS